MFLPFFWLIFRSIFCPLDPDPGSNNVVDPKHCEIVPTISLNCLNIKKNIPKSSKTLEGQLTNKLEFLTKFILMGFLPIKSNKTKLNLKY